MFPKENIHIEPLETILGKADDIFFVFDTEKLALRYVNDAFERIFQRKTEELFSSPEALFNCIHPEDFQYVQDNFTSWLSKPTPGVLEFRICRPDQTNRWIRLKTYPLVVEGQVKSISGIAEDDTARKVSMLSLQQINGWKNANLEIIAHDLCGPIGIVKMLASLIGKKLPDNTEILRLTQLIDDISRRNIDLIQGLRSTEAKAAASVELNKERLDVVWTIQQALDLYLKSQDQLQKDIVFTTSHKQIYAAIDGLKFMQIIHVLVSNAINVTPGAGKIKVHLEELEAHFLLSVADTGPGIPKKNRPILFNDIVPAGEKVELDLTSNPSSLSLVKKLTDEHQGRIWFETAEDKGTTFYVEIPLGLQPE